MCPLRTNCVTIAHLDADNETTNNDDNDSDQVASCSNDGDDGSKDGGSAINIKATKG